jgi:biopolymer transport protein ExbD
MSDERKSITVTILAAGPMTLKLEQADIDKLVAAIKNGEQWVEVADEKRAVTLRADLIASYALDPEEKDERRAGF